MKNFYFPLRLCLITFIALNLHVFASNSERLNSADFLAKNYFPHLGAEQFEHVERALNSIDDYWDNRIVAPESLRSTFIKGTLGYDFPRVAFLDLPDYRSWSQQTGYFNGTGWMMEEDRNSVEMLMHELMRVNSPMVNFEVLFSGGAIVGESGRNPNGFFLNDSETYFISTDDIIIDLLIWVEVLNKLIFENPLIVYSGPDGALDFLLHYYYGGKINGKTVDFDLIERGYGKILKPAVKSKWFESLPNNLAGIAKGQCGTGVKKIAVTNASNIARAKDPVDLTLIIFAVGNTILFSDVEGMLVVDCDNRIWDFEGKRFHDINDEFTDPLDLKEFLGGFWPWSGDLPGGTAYKIKAHWEAKYFGVGSF